MYVYTYIYIYIYIYAHGAWGRRVRPGAVVARVASAGRHRCGTSKLDPKLFLMFTLSDGRKVGVFRRIFTSVKSYVGVLLRTVACSGPYCWYACRCKDAVIIVGVWQRGRIQSLNGRVGRHKQWYEIGFNVESLSRSSNSGSGSIGSIVSSRGRSGSGRGSIIAISNNSY